MNKSPISILILLLLAVTGARSWGEPGFAELRAEYAKALERIDAAEAKGTIPPEIGGRRSGDGPTAGL